jgi:hypothetical protein
MVATAARVLMDGRWSMDPMIAACLAVVAAMAIGFVVMKRRKA